MPLPVGRGVGGGRSALHPRDPPAEVRLQLRVADVQSAPLQAAGHERPLGVLDQLVGRLGVLLGERLDAPPRSIDARALAALDDPDHSVRANVCVLLGNVRPATGRERLAAVADADPDLDVREKARWALGRLGW